MKHVVLCTGAFALAVAAYSAAQTVQTRPRPTVAPVSSGQKVEWSVAMIERAKQKGIKTFNCPATLRIEPRGSFGPASLAWKSASAYASSCASSSDLAPTNDRGNFVLIVSGYMAEDSGDHSFFGKSLKFVIGDRGDILNGSKADINACFAAYGANRPFSGISGQQRILAGDFDWDTLIPVWCEGNLIFSAHYRVDQKGDNDKVGFDRISFEPLRVLIK